MSEAYTFMCWQSTATTEHCLLAIGHFRRHGRGRDRAIPAEAAITRALRSGIALAATSALLNALRKLVEFNEQLGATAGQARYPPLPERARFVAQLIGRLESARPSRLVRRSR